MSAEPRAESWRVARRRSVADGDQMKVIGHQGVGGDPNLALFAERADEGEEMVAVLVGGEYGVVCCCRVG